MKINYKFANGEISEVEVDKQLGDVIVDFDRIEYNNDQTETRRHTSLDDMDYEGEFFADTTDLLEIILRGETANLIRSAVSLLKPQQQELINALYLSSKPLSQSELAAQLGISERSVQQNARRAKAKLRELIENIKK